MATHNRQTSVSNRRMHPPRAADRSTERSFQEKIKRQPTPEGLSGVGNRPVNRGASLNYDASGRVQDWTRTPRKSVSGQGLKTRVWYLIDRLWRRRLASRRACEAGRESECIGEGNSAIA